MIGMWESATLPAGWVLCDGSNGTPDLTDHYVEITDESSDGSGTGDNSITGTTSAADYAWSHTHTWTNAACICTWPGTNYSAHGSKSVPHDHDGAFTCAAGDYKPAYYALYFIMFKG